MDFDEKQEQRRLRQRQFWAAEAEQALTDVSPQVADAVAAVDRMKSALAVGTSQDHMASTDDILKVAAAAAEANHWLAETVHELGGAAILLNESTTTVAKACRSSNSTVLRWSGQDRSADSRPDRDTDTDKDNTSSAAQDAPVTEIQNVEES